MYMIFTTVSEVCIYVYTCKEQCLEDVHYFPHELVFNSICPTLIFNLKR